MDEILIEQVRQHEVLYDHSSPSYRDQRMRQESWEEIGTKLKITADKAKQMWDKLRRCYNNARNRRLSTKCGQAAKSIPGWKFEKQMSFLLPYMESRRTYSNLVLCNKDDPKEHRSQDDAETMDSEVGKWIEKIEKYKHTSQGDEHHSEKMEKQKNYNKTNAATEIIAIETQENANLRKRKYENEEKRTEPGKSSSFESMDDVDLFFLSMARITKKLPQYRQTSVKLAVSNAVLRAEQQSLGRKPYYSSETSVPTSSRSTQTTCTSEINFCE